MSKSDVDERAFWDENMDAFETCVNRTAWKHSPWYVVPADHKWYARLVISRIILNELEDMEPKWPEMAKEERKSLAAQREQLMNEDKKK